MEEEATGATEERASSPRGMVRRGGMMLVVELTVDDLLDLTRDTLLRLEEDGGNARYIVAVDRADESRACAVSPDEEAVVRRQSHRSNRLPCGE